MAENSQKLTYYQKNRDAILLKSKEFLKIIKNKEKNIKERDFAT